MLNICLPCIWTSLKVYCTHHTTKNIKESWLTVEVLGEGRMNREILIDDLQVVIDILNLRGLDEGKNKETRNYPCGDRKMPVPLTIRLNL